jgi:hypothetical protein
MIEEITSLGYGEFSKRYHGTLGFLASASGKKRVVSVIDVGRSYTLVTDKNNTEYRLNNDTGCQMEFTQVPSQWFQPVKDCVVYVHRRPERQWRRGICADNTQIWTPRKSGESLMNIAVDAGKISQLFYPDSDSKDFDDLYKINCGLWSKYFAWTVNTVWLKNLPIGKVDHKTKTITLATGLFEQEMRDALIRSNSEYQVKIQ